LTLGYDDNATSGLDPIFGETNSITQPWDSVFEVRITDEYWNRIFLQTGSGTFHLDKQIATKTNCDTWPYYPTIDIKTENFPVTISWDSTLFDNTCIKGSFITAIEYGMWFHVAPEFLSQKSSCKIANGNDINNPNAGSYYNSTDGDNIYTIWFGFADFNLLTASIDEPFINSVSIAPNPFANSFTIDSDTPFSAINLVDAMGKNIRFERNAHSITPINCSSGIYFLSVLFENGQSSKYKLIKQ
jgi:hypothetical protein